MEGETSERRMQLILKRAPYDKGPLQKLLSLAGGNQYMIIYLKMLLLANDNGGCIDHKDGVKTMSEEIAQEINEDPDDVALCLNFLRNKRIALFASDLIPTEQKRQGKNVTARFKPPSLEEVAEYCRENMLAVNPEIFMDYYNQNGWMAGRYKMKDWKAAARNWHRREQDSFNEQQKGRKTTDWDINDL